MEAIRAPLTRAWRRVTFAVRILIGCVLWPPAMATDVFLHFWHAEQLGAVARQRRQFIVMLVFCTVWAHLLLMCCDWISQSWGPQSLAEKTRVRVNVSMLIDAIQEMNGTIGQNKILELLNMNDHVQHSDTPVLVASLQLSLHLDVVSALNGIAKCSCLLVVSCATLFVRLLLLALLDPWRVLGTSLILVASFVALAA